MQFRNATSVRGQSSRRWFFIIGIIALQAIWIFPGTVGYASDIVSYPFYSLRTWFRESESSIPTFFRSQTDMAREIEALKAEIARASYDALRLRALEEENALLRGATGTESERLVADVVREPSETPYDTLIINKGSGDGIKEGAIVYGHRESAIGSVRRTYAQSSLVVLFSTPGVIAPVYIYGPNIFARAVGIGGGVLRIEVPQGIELKEGDPVVVPAARGMYGVIDHIEVSPSNPAQYAYVSEAPAITKLRFVTVDREPLPNIVRAEAEALLMPSKEATTTIEAFEGLMTEIDTVATSTIVQ